MEGGTPDEGEEGLVEVGKKPQRGEARVKQGRRPGHGQLGAWGKELQGTGSSWEWEWLGCRGRWRGGEGQSCAGVAAWSVRGGWQGRRSGTQGCCAVAWRKPVLRAHLPTPNLSDRPAAQLCGVWVLGVGMAFTTH